MGHAEGTGQGLMRGQAGTAGEALVSFRSLRWGCLVDGHIGHDGCVNGTARGEAPSRSTPLLYTSLKALVRAHYRLWLYPAAAIKYIMIPATYKITSRLNGLDRPSITSPRYSQRTAKYA
jgi:hypothetical protein